MAKLNLLTIRAASRDSGISYKVLLEAAKSGRIRTINLSKRPRISAEALEDFIQEARGGLIRQPDRQVPAA